MIDAPQLLKDLQRQLKSLEEELRERVGEVAEIDEMPFGIMALAHQILSPSLNN